MSQLRRRPGVTPITPDEARDRLNAAAGWIDQANAPVQGGAGEGVRPWMLANDRVVYSYNLRLKESLYLKLKFLSENEPNASMHSIAIEAIEREVNARLRKYEKPANEGHAGRAA